ncbi:glutamyl-tRNA(Gln) amidotransferase subunit C, mitochondrial [Bacillus rossius redtenbacheri]|uniref:glutamyl-tRNA(Gln) amidotransferase subunit C, mitochondrial n=1 Tax=Bacillus rossius redtenbacheri TaxID=93214 RepID=UPI002FDE19F1
MLRACGRARHALSLGPGARRSSSVPDCDAPLDHDTITLLQRLSLVDLGSRKVVDALREAVRFASVITTVDTSGVQPMVSVLDDRTLRLRRDAVTDGDRRDQVLASASVTEEEYLVAPPGNVPLAPRGVPGQ